MSQGTACRCTSSYRTARWEMHRKQWHLANWESKFDHFAAGESSSRLSDSTMCWTAFPSHGSFKGKLLTNSTLVTKRNNFLAAPILINCRMCTMPVLQSNDRRCRNRRWWHHLKTWNHALHKFVITTASRIVSTWNKSNLDSIKQTNKLRGLQSVPCRRNLVPAFVDRRVSRGQRGGSPTVVNISFLDRSRDFSLKYHHN
jgi:hypothetical protein